MTTILDLDLDFFVTPIKTGGSGLKRLADDQYFVEPVSGALKFMHEKCLVPETMRMKGGVFENHDEVFDWMRNGVAEGKLVPPFRVVHIDAHSDIGHSGSDWLYLFTELLHKPVAERTNPKRGGGGLHMGNFLVFVAACGWLGELQFVTHPNWSNDLNGMVMMGFDLGADYIQLKRFDPKTIKNIPITTMLWDLPHELEEAVPFARISRDEFQMVEPADYLLLTRSPGFTPPDADRLYEIISKLICCEY